MATRATITIQSHHKRTDLYRHWDGYLAATGAHLGHVLRALPCFTQEAAVVALLTAQEGQPHGAGKYELTNRASDHSDREWHYEITLHHMQEPTIKVFERPIGGKACIVFEGGLFAFRKYVAGHLRSMLRLIRSRRAA